MTNRREFLQIGFAATTLPMAGGLLAEPSVPAVPAAAVPLYKVLFDERFAPGHAFGAEAARAGQSVLGFAGGDITDFWRSDLEPHWRRARQAIAGFTRHEPLSVLERRARDRGLKVIFRAEHRPVDGGFIEHRLSGAAFSLYQAAALPTAGQEWSRTMAAIVTQCAAGCAAGNQTLITRTAYRLPDEEPFYSWVIAPRS